jgi:ABC-type phosphate transport system permease subunit
MIKLTRLKINEMKKICSIIVALLSLTFFVDAQTFDPVLASELQYKIDSI